ncbi:K+ channel tetramerization domain protein [Dictyocaulus viviparus]|uniref:K+ channel tetramerization domain protein n=1 Tax=Dictyocaulus viviparus TaxID=29172 RepID=A0A0D8XMF2_DICVI|nr:K+ channel tetramerization domain protein [Dictyocaulus viviparus]
MDETCHLLQNNESSSSSMVLVNVGGRRARLSYEMIVQRLDGCRLSAFCRKSHVEKLSDCDAYFEHADEYYFERSPIVFEYIVDFFVTGMFLFPP